ncbi:hypothetical protein E0485_01410 [Paenibacillus albiflavus]|uniref:Uncharacterized protein n=1 Tax=Paenibacillus albiflavus TaxID=2545760 RepID=A0A4R4ELR1_9BACL|nr:hypothetical protein [Paenibacillus albiflavus]TCZ80969.1 hypothetical protein E0485_01410 [Paenibacillus albiflavus]
MKATQDVLRVWRKFDQHPMETITKAWYASQSGQNKQRSVTLMKEHREQFGTAGNCFDLALWLMDELKAEGIHAYAIGHDLHTPEAHVAVVAVNDEGNSYFCDLGDQWIDPILITRNSSDFCEDALSGFITGGKISVQVGSNDVLFKYIRPSGKVSKQKFNLQPIPLDELQSAASFSQSLLRNPLVEMRVYTPEEVIHWEFDRWNSFMSSNSGLMNEPKLIDDAQWADRIHLMSGIDREVICKALVIYSKKG